MGESEVGRRKWEEGEGVKWAGEGQKRGGRGTKKERREDINVYTTREELTLTSLAAVYGLSDAL